jgi:uncharacterized membrane protein YphA (DoxX/SURF4 family)
MLTATFVVSAVRHLTHWSAALDEMAGDGMPLSSFLLTGSIVLRLIGGLSILLGFYARAGAALLVVFVVPAALLAHNFWAMLPARQTHCLLAPFARASITRVIRRPCTQCCKDNGVYARYRRCC